MFHSARRHPHLFTSQKMKGVKHCYANILNFSSLVFMYAVGAPTLLRSPSAD